MKPSFAAILLFIFGAGAAVAMPSPYGVERTATVARDSAIYLGPAGAELESSYFRVPAPRRGARRIFPCRFELRAERTGAVVQSCD